MSNHKSKKGRDTISPVKNQLEQRVAKTTMVIVLRDGIIVFVEVKVGTRLGIYLI